MNYYNDFNERGSQAGTIAISTGTIGIVTGIILCILQAIGKINIGWFWATFPFWIPIAADIAILIIILIITGIIILIEKAKE